MSPNKFAKKCNGVNKGECRNGRLGPPTIAATLTRPFLRTGISSGCGMSSDTEQQFNRCAQAAQVAALSHWRMNRTYALAGGRIAPTATRISSARGSQGRPCSGPDQWTDRSDPKHTLLPLHKVPQTSAHCQQAAAAAVPVVRRLAERGCLLSLSPSLVSWFMQLKPEDMMIHSQHIHL